MIAYNVTAKPVKAKMTGWNVGSGQWEVKLGPGDAKNGLRARPKVRTIAFEKTASVDVEFAPHKTTVYEFTLKKPNSEAPNTRADLGIGTDDVVRQGNKLSVTVHSLGAQDANPASVRVVDGHGKVVAQAATPSLPAPKDLKPHTVTVTLALPAKFNPAGAVIQVVSTQKEITLLNNKVLLPGR